MLYTIKSCICDVNSGYLHTKQTEISRKQSEQTKIFKISYYIISEVLKNEMIKRIEVIFYRSHLSAWEQHIWRNIWYMFPKTLRLIFLVLFQAIVTPLGFLFWTIFRESPFGLHPAIHITTWFSIAALVPMVPSIFLYNTG